MLVAILVLGVYPQLLFEIIDPAVNVALKGVLIVTSAVLSSVIAQVSDVPFTVDTRLPRLAPEIVLAVVVCVVLVADLFLEETREVDHGVDGRIRLLGVHPDPHAGRG